tara:strand:+ start:1332 stop:1847 length:516 start_codon:yes stop_codon:yes gene_type:complete
MLSHEAFEIMWNVYTGQLTELSTTKLCGLHEVVHNGFVKIEKRGNRFAVFGTQKLLHTLKAFKQKQLPPKNYLIKNPELKAFNLNAFNSETVNNFYEFDTVGPLIARSVKYSNPSYRAVVDGKQPRRNPITEYARKLSPIDAADFWQAYGELSDDEQTAYRRSFASAAGRG